MTALSGRLREVGACWHLPPLLWALRAWGGPVWPPEACGQQAWEASEHGPSRWPEPTVRPSEWEKVGTVLRGAWLRGSPEKRVATLGTHGRDPKKLRTQKSLHKQSKEPYILQMQGLRRDPETHTRILGEAITYKHTHTHTHTQSQTLCDGWTHLGR